MKRDGECQDDITLELQQCFVMEQSSTFSSNSTSLLVYTCQFSPWYPVSLPDTNLCLSPAFINCSYLPSSSLSPSPVSITGLLWSSIAQEVEGPTGNGNGSDPRLCQSVLEQDAPEEQVGTLPRSLSHQCVKGWMRERKVLWVWSICLSQSLPSFWSSRAAGRTYTISRSAGDAA